MSVTVCAPGKLYLAGEYAVLDAKASAILFAVNRYLRCTITETEASHGALDTSHAAESLPWQWQQHAVTGLEDFDLISEAITLVGHLTDFYPVVDIAITTELEEKNGRKYGLGSSAAVTVAVLKVMLGYCHCTVTPLQLFKLACIVHYRTHHNGSYGDLAAAAFGGCISFHNFDHHLLEDGIGLRGEALWDFINAKWEGLEIVPLAIPHNWKLAVAWTEKPASTEQLIQQELTLSEKEIAQAFQQLLSETRECLMDINEGIVQDNYSLMTQALAKNRDSLTNYTKASGKPYWTPEAEHAVAIARKLTEATKISGAGGGDCVIALAPSAEVQSRIKNAWQKENLTVLPLEIARRDNYDHKPKK